MTDDDSLNQPLEDLSPEELKDALGSGDITIDDIRENEEIRERLHRLVVKMDMDEHRDIYDRLAEV